MRQYQRRTSMNKWHAFSVGLAETRNSYMMENTDLYLQ